MAQETAKIIEVDKLTIWVLTDNYFDTLGRTARSPNGTG